VEKKKPQKGLSGPGFSAAEKPNDPPIVAKALLKGASGKRSPEIQPYVRRSKKGGQRGGALLGRADENELGQENRFLKE